MPSLRILVDANVPFARELYSQFGTVRTAPGSAITREKLRETDVLIVRSVTRVNRALIEGTPVRFVGSTTIGLDHIETGFLHHRGTAFAHAPGSNADSVVEYVIAALLCVAGRRNYNLAGKKVGVVGCGNVGGRLCKRLPHLGLSIVKSDPPLAASEEEAERAHAFRPIEEVVEESDIISLHVPLERGGKYPTEFLFDDHRLRSMKRGSWIVNTSRGAVVDNEALVDVLRSSKGGPDVAVLDVWEGEPAPLSSLIDLAAIATPHIAGYSYDGKVSGAIMIAEALARHLGSTLEADRLPGAPPARDVTPPDPALPQLDWLHDLVRQMYDIGADDEPMRHLAGLDPSERQQRFAALRRDYPVRRSFAAHGMSRSMIPGRYFDAVRQGIQANVVSPA